MAQGDERRTHRAGEGTQKAETCAGRVDLRAGLSAHHLAGMGHLSLVLACANGVLDLQTGELHVGKPEDYLRTAIPTAWTGLDTPAPRFQQFLQEVFQDKPESERTVLIAFVQRLLGYSITGELSHHIFTIFYGAEGRNG